MLEKDLARLERETAEEVLPGSVLAKMDAWQDPHSWPESSPPKPLTLEELRALVQARGGLAPFCRDAVAKIVPQRLDGKLNHKLAQKHLILRSLAGRVPRIWQAKNDATEEEVLAKFLPQLLGALLELQKIPGFKN